MIIDKTTQEEVKINVFIDDDLKDKVKQITKELENWEISSTHLISVTRNKRNDMSLTSLNCDIYLNESRFSITVKPILKLGLVITNSLNSDIFKTIGSRSSQMAHAIFENGKLTLVKEGLIYHKDLDETEGSIYFPVYNSYTEEEFWETFSIYSHNEFEYFVKINEDCKTEQVVQTALP